MESMKDFKLAFPISYTSKIPCKYKNAAESQLNMMMMLGLYDDHDNHDDHDHDNHDDHDHDDHDDDDDDDDHDGVRLNI